MKRNIELVVLILLYVLLGTLIIKSNDQRSIFMLPYTSCLFISMGTLFFGNLYFLYSYFQKGQFKRYFLLNLVLLTITYLLSAFFYASWIADIVKTKILASHLVHPSVVQEILPILISVLVISFIYSGIKSLVINQKFKFLKMVVVYSLAGFVIIGAGLFINMQIDLSYKGNQETWFIENQYNNLDEIIQLPQFRGKVVYIDLWYSSCGPCIKEFQHLTNLKAQLKGDEVAFLYLARETSHPNSRQRWINAIKKYNLQGWHLFMSKHQEQQVWTTILKNQQDSTTAIYPRYLLADKMGNFVSLDAKRPSSGEEIVAQIESLL